MAGRKLIQNQYGLAENTDAENEYFNQMIFHLVLYVLHPRSVMLLVSAYVFKS